MQTFQGSDGRSKTVSRDNPLPVDIGQNVSVSLGAEVEVKNDSGNPVPVAPNVQQGGGAITPTTTRVTLATDGPGVVALASIDNKTPALQTGNVPVVTTASPTDGNGNGTRAYNFGGHIRQAFTATSTAAIPLPALGPSREVMLHASQRCFIRFGDNTVIAAAVAAGHLVLATEERFHLRIPAGTTHFTVIRDTTDGNLNVTAVL